MRGPPPMASLRWLTSSCRRPAHSPEMSTCAKAGAPARRMTAARSPARLTLDRASIYVNPSDVYKSGPPVPAAGHEIGEPDFVDLAQIRLLDPAADLGSFLTLGVNRRHRRDVETQPAHRCDREFGLDEVFRGAVPVGVIADEPGAVGQLDHRTDHMKARRPRLPADLRAA